MDIVVFSHGLLIQTAIEWYLSLQTSNLESSDVPRSACIILKENKGFSCVNFLLLEVIIYDFVSILIFFFFFQIGNGSKFILKNGYEVFLMWTACHWSQVKIRLTHDMFRVDKIQTNNGFLT